MLRRWKIYSCLYSLAFACVLFSGFVTPVSLFAETVHALTWMQNTPRSKLAFVCVRTSVGMRSVKTESTCLLKSSKRLGNSESVLHLLWPFAWIKLALVHGLNKSSHADANINNRHASYSKMISGKAFFRSQSVSDILVDLIMSRYEIVC